MIHVSISFLNQGVMRFLSLAIFSFLLIHNVVGGNKSFKTRRGDIYDCIDFYKQPSFDHPRLKNHNFHPMMRPSFIGNTTKMSVPPKEDKSMRKGCPVGTVPIRRVKKGASKIESLVATNEPSGSYDAGVRTKPGSARYSGGGMVLSIWNPPRVRTSAYSEARMKISSGPDSIEVGWRVDPSLRGDNLTRDYIYTNAGETKCFDANCGFVLVNPKEPLNEYFNQVSTVDGGIYEYMFNITRDSTNGNWWLTYGFDNTEIGFWPKSIFTKLGDQATDVEWAGEVYSPPGVYEPVMGSGYKPNLGNPAYVAYFSFLTVQNENYTYVYADNLEEFATDRSLYDVKDLGNKGPRFQHLVLYGGARY